ncbi:MAG: CheR family methyltransferase [Spirochaetota bacterium]
MKFTSGALAIFLESQLGIDLSNRINQEHLGKLRKNSKLYGKLSEEEYVNHLQQSSTTDSEWQCIYNSLNISESFFFRDKRQIDLLEKHIFPKLAQKEVKEIKIWSAGCSTGQEAHTLSILASRTLAQNKQYSIQGTDINPESIQIAEKAIYHPWFVRVEEESTLAQYFEKKSQGKYRFLQENFPTVHFSLLNLITDTFPNKQELILCRNVLIYIKNEMANLILNKFVRALAPGGYLLLGHAEYNAKLPTALEAVNIEGSIIYRKKTNHSAKQENPKPYTPNIPLSQPSKQEKTNLSPQEIVQKNPLDYEAQYKMGNEYEKNSEYHHAIRCYQKAIYLNQEHKDSYLSLYRIYYQQKDQNNMQKIYKSGIQIPGFMEGVRNINE